MAAGGGALLAALPGKPSGAFAEVDSSESDGENEPAESFHRRITTNKEIKCSVSSRRGRGVRREAPPLVLCLGRGHPGSPGPCQPVYTPCSAYFITL